MKDTTALRLMALVVVPAIFIRSSMSCLHISICHFAGRADRRRHRKNRRRSNRPRAGEATHRSFYNRRRTDRRPWASVLFQCGHTSGRSTLNRVRLLHSFGDGNTCSHYSFKSFIPASESLGGLKLPPGSRLIGLKETVASMVRPPLPVLVARVGVC